MSIKLFLSKFGFFDRTNMSKPQRILEMSIICLFLLIFFSTISLNYVPPFNYVNMVLYFIQCVIITIWAFKYRVFVLNPYLPLIVILNLIIFLSGLINNGNPLFLSTMIFLPLASFFFSQFLNSINNREKILFTFNVSFVLFLVFFTVIYYKELLSLEVIRIGTFFSDQNLLGYVFTFGFLTILDIVIRKKVYFLSIISLYTLFLIFTTGSRSALLICIFCTILYLFLSFNKKNIKLFWILTISILVIFVVLIFLPPFDNFRKRLISSITEIFVGTGGDDSTILRMQYIIDGIEYSFRRLLFGYGSNEAALIISREGQSTHNNFLDMTLNYGFFFTLAFEGFIIFLFYIANNFGFKQKKLFICLISCIFFVQFFFPNYWTKPEYLLFPFVVGMIPNKYRIAISYENRKFSILLPKQSSFFTTLEKHHNLTICNIDI